MKLVPLTRGLFAQVDDDRFEALSEHKWHALKAANDYFVAARRAPGGGTILMHRVIMGALPGQQVDHKYGNSLNNQCYNLRLLAAHTAHAEQQHGFLRKRRGSSSNYRGVSWHKRAGKWRAEIKHGTHRYHLGLFTDEAAAAKAFDAKARELGWPEYGLNFPLL